MDKKKILIVAATFYPLNSPRANRTTELAKEFVKQGHAVTVITPFDCIHHLSFAQKHGFTIKDLGAKKFNALTIKKNKFASITVRVINRLMNLLLEYPDIEWVGKVKKAVKKESGYDLLVSIAVPHPVHWGVAAARSANHRIAKVWVADCGDPYMGDRTDSFRKLFYFKLIEKWFCKKADYIAVPVIGAVAAYYNEFHVKIKIIPQGFNFNDTPVYKWHIGNDIPIFAYAGGFIPGVRDPAELINFLVNQSRPYKFIIYTANTAMVDLFVNPGLNNIEIKAFISRIELIYELSKMDFLINFTNGNSVQKPSKLIDYALAGRPVMSVDTGNLNTAVVKEFLSGDYTNQLNIGDIEIYNITKVAEQFLALVNK